MSDWSDWLNQHWYEVSVLIGLALLVVNTSRAAAYLAGVLGRLDSIERDISGLHSIVNKWELAWRVSDADRERERRFSR